MRYVLAALAAVALGALFGLAAALANCSATSNGSGGLGACSFDLSIIILATSAGIGLGGFLVLRRK
jgi:hypothetical protein